MSNIIILYQRGACFSQKTIVCRLLPQITDGGFYFTLLKKATALPNILMLFNSLSE